MQSSQTQTIEIVVNGEKITVPDGLTVKSLLCFLNVDPERVAVELNRSIVRRTEWQHAPIEPGSQLEIVQFVGGG